MCAPLFQEVIVRDSSSGWDLGPDLDHFSSRTRHVLQYMNPNKINMDLLVDLIDYLGTQTGSICHRFIHVLYIKYEISGVWFFFLNFVLFCCWCRCQTKLHSLWMWMEPFSCSCQVWLISSSCSTCCPQTRGFGIKPGGVHALISNLKEVVTQTSPCLTVTFVCLEGTGLLHYTQPSHRRIRPLPLQCPLVGLERYFKMFYNHKNSQGNIM